MIIRLQNILATVEDSTEAERKWLTDYLSIGDKSARFRGRQDSRIRLFNLLGYTFPAGYATQVRRVAMEEGFKVDLLDSRKRPEEPREDADLAWLRDHQHEAVQAGVRMTRGIFDHPMGSGKGDLACAFVKLIPARWLFVVYKAGVAVDVAERHNRISPHLGTAGIIAEGEWSTGEWLTCATFQALYARLKANDPVARELVSGVTGILVDEAHTLPAETFAAVARGCSSAYWRFGFSATPLDRTDRRSAAAIGALGPVIHRIESKKLVDLGIIARPRVRLVTCEQDSWASTYPEVYGSLIVRSAKRNETVVQMVQRAEKPALVFVRELEHGYILDALLGKRGLRTQFVHGAHSSEYRLRVVRESVRGALDAVICSNVLEAGLDVAGIRSTVNAAAGESVIGAIQKAGRGGRIERDKAGNVVKDEHEVWDVLDKGQEWLERHARSRKNAYVKRGYETKIEAEGATV